MATLDELIIRIEANTSQLRREMKRGADAVESNTRRMGQSLKKSDAAFARLAKSALRFGAVLGVAALGRSVIGEVISFSRALNDLSAVTGATGKDLDFFKNKAKEMGRTTTKSAVETLQAFKLIASAKPELLQNADALAEITRQAIILSEASRLTLPEAANALTTALNQFSQPAEEAARFINVMAAGAQLGAAEIPPLTQALEKTGTTASQANISFELLVATIQRLAKFKEPTERMATGLKNVLLKLSIGADETNPKVVGLTQALKNLADQALSDAEFLKRFGSENINVARQLLKTVDSAEKLAVAIAGTNTALVQAEAQTQGAEGATLDLANAWKNLNLAIGEGNGLIDQSIGVMARFLNGLGLLASGLRNLDFGENTDLIRAMLANEGIILPSRPGATTARARSPIEEIPVTSRTGGAVAPFRDVTLRPATGPGGPREREFERLEEVRAETKKLLDQINQDFLRATGRDAEAIVAIFAVRKAEVEKLLRASGDISDEEIQRILGQLDTIRNNAVMGLDASTEAAERFGDAMNFAFQNAILLGQDLDKVLIRMIKSAALFGVDGKSGLFGGILSSATGSIAAAFTIPGFAHGGSPQVGVPSIVGERGPEIFIPRVPGTIFSNADSRRMGGPNVIVNNFQTFNPGISNVEQAAIRNSQIAMSTLTKQEIIDSLNGIRR